jgi:hypothetical protein
LDSSTGAIVSGVSLGIAAGTGSGASGRAFFSAARRNLCAFFSLRAAILSSCLPENCQAIGVAQFPNHQNGACIVHPNSEASTVEQPLTSDRFVLILTSGLFARRACSDQRPESGLLELTRQRRAGLPTLRFGAALLSRADEPSGAYREKPAATSFAEARIACKLPESRASSRFLIGVVMLAHSSRDEGARGR